MILPPLVISPTRHPQAYRLPYSCSPPRHSNGRKNSLTLTLGHGCARMVVSRVCARRAWARVRGARQAEAGACARGEAGAG
jgi:hypothetical protein